MNCTLQNIIDYLNQKEILVSSNIISNQRVLSLSYDSRECKKGTLFFCKGLNFKEEFLNSAIENNISCYISETQYNNETDCIIVRDIRLAMAYVSSLFFDHPSRKLTTIGITGTKGKTTVAYFLKNILDRSSTKPAGLLGTMEIITGKQHSKAKLTTPEPTDLHKYFNEAVESNLDYFIMEVSSQAYKVNRVEDILFNYGLFLNIAPDHISEFEHPDFEDYFNSKLKLIENCKEMLLCNTMDDVDVVINRCIEHNTPYITYGTNVGSMYQIINVKKQHAGYTFDLIDTLENNTTSYAIKMNGTFNIENAVVAIIIAKKEGIALEVIQQGLIETEIIGRMNIFENNDLTVVVDYAHNQISFKKLYEAILTDYPNRRIITVGGVPGNKAYPRRKDFATIVGGASDYIYLTADDPQYEEVSAICDAIIEHFDPRVKYEIIEDRIEAAEKAFENALPGDVIVLLAKGDDNIQRVRGQHVIIESDIEIAHRLLKI